MKIKSLFNDDLLLYVEILKASIKFYEDDIDYNNNARHGICIIIKTYFNKIVLKNNNGYIFINRGLLLDIIFNNIIWYRKLYIQFFECEYWFFEDSIGRISKEKWNKPRIKLLKKVLFKIQKEIKRRNI